MGCYDTVLVSCPECGFENDFQSKSGECTLSNYTIDNCPDDVLSDVNRHAPYKCKCGLYLSINIKTKDILINENKQ